MNFTTSSTKIKLATAFAYIMFPLLTITVETKKSDKPIFIEENALKVFNFVKPYLPDNPVILEAGAYNGLDTVKMVKVWPKAKIHAFEPVPVLFKQLKAKCRRLKQVSCYQLALADKPGEADFYLSQWNKTGKCAASGSLLAPTPFKEEATKHLIKFKEIITVPVDTVDAWAKKNGVDHIDFMWLDMQGGELAMLKAATSLLPKVKVIYAEVEFVEAYKDQPVYKDVKNWLLANGFRLIALDFNEELALAGKVVEGNANGFWGNALFINKSLEIKH